MFNVNQITPGLKKVKERLFTHLIDCLLCQAYSYLKLDQSRELAIQMMNQVLLVEPHNIEALFLRLECYERSKEFLRASSDEQLLRTILTSKGLCRPS